MAVVHTGYSSVPTVEMTWALILASQRHLVREAASLRSGGWQQAVGGDLQGRTLGLLGLVNIGGAFGMEVIGWSQNLLPGKAAAVGATAVSKKGLFALKRLVAPFNGVVTARNINIGDYVSATGADPTRSGSQPLFAVADVHKLRIFVSVPQNFSDALRPGLTATMTLPQNPGKKIPLQFLTTAKAVIAATRTVVTEPTLDNPNGELWPGTYVSVTFAFPGDPDVLVAPEQAVLFRARARRSR